jgi:DNA-binding beta-propeller fold protein YncE
MKKSAAAWVLGFGLLAAVVVLPQNVALPQTTPEGKSSKPAPEDIPPVRMIADPYPAFNGIAVDPANGLVAMSDPNRKSLLLYDQARGASKDGGISTPLRQIAGPATYLGMIAGVVLDSRRQEMYTVNNDIEDTVVVMPYGGFGDAKPSRVFSVPHQSWGLALGNAADQIAVTVEIQNTIAFYRRQVTGVEAPLRLIRGQATGLADPHGIYWDESHDEIGVANHGNFRGLVQNTGGGCEESPVVDDAAEAGESRPPSIRIFPAGAKGDVKPLRVIEGSRTGLDWPMGVAYDARHDAIVVANNGDDSILIYGRASNGDVAPVRVIRGDRTGMNRPIGIAVDAQKGEIWVSNWGDHSALAFDSAGQGNIVPKETIRSAPAGTPTPGFGNPMALAYDSKREALLVPN